MPPAHAAELVLTTLTSLLALGWFYQAATAFRGIPTIADLTLPNSPLPIPTGPGPDVTVIVPACNEEAAIQATIRSLLASTGVRLQIIAVDDRSTDRTGPLMDAVAAESRTTPHLLEVIHNQELPSGWLGKTHALSLAAARATAPWLLFTDGDVAFHPRTIALSLGYAQAKQADHVVLLLTIESKRIMEAAVFAAFQAVAGWSIRIWKVADPKARDFFGTGGFNFVRRAVFDQVGGISDLHMEVVEDLSLGWKIKRAGFSQHVVFGPGLVRIHWIQGVFGIVNLMEKNGFAGFRYRVEVALAGCMGLAVNIALPLAAIALGGWPAVAGLAVYAAIVLTYLANRPATRVSPWLALLFAPATTLFLFAIARSTFLTLSRNGVVWRGTFYPLKDLRKNAIGWW